MENWNSKFLKLKSLIPESHYQDTRKEYNKSPNSFKNSVQSPKLLRKTALKSSKIASPKSSLIASKEIPKEDSNEVSQEEVATVEKTLEKKENFSFNIQTNHQSPKGKKRDAQGQLNAILKKKQKIKELEKIEPEKSKELKLEHEWKKAQALATGKKVKDDPVLLRKSLSRTRKIKKKSEKEWQNRIKSTQQGIKERQKKRLENIQNKKIKNKKDKKGKKKSRPGFEGKKSKK